MFGYLEAIDKGWDRPKITAEDLSTTVPERIDRKTKRKLASHLIEDEAESTSCSNHTSLADSGSESDGDDSIITSHSSTTDPEGISPRSAYIREQVQTTSAI